MALPDATDDAVLEKLLFPAAAVPRVYGTLPNFTYIHTELKKKSVTLRLLWEEYLAEHPGGYRYTQFCHHYRLWRGRITPSMRQVHKAT